MCKLFKKRKEDDKKKEEERMGITEILIILAIGGVIGYALWRSAASTSQKGSGKERLKDRETETSKGKGTAAGEDTKKWFEEKYWEWYDKFLGYYLEDVANQKPIPVTKLSKFNQFLKERGLKKYFAKPVVEAFFDFTGEKNEVIKEFLKKQNFPINHPDEPRKDLEEFIKQKARKEAETIVKEFIKQEGENGQ